MNALSQKEVQHIARLARLELTEQEVADMQKGLSAVLDYFNDLQDVDTINVEATFQTQALENVMRQDKAEPEEPATIIQMLKQAPAKQGRQIKVKSVL